MIAWFWCYEFGYTFPKNVNPNSVIAFAESVITALAPFANADIYKSPATATFVDKFIVN